MRRLAQFDVTRRIDDRNLRAGVKLLFGLGCAGAMILLRSVVDIAAPTAGPFALVYPTVLLATLYGHWQAGAVAYATSFLWAWYFVLPSLHSFRFEVATDPPRVLINAAATLIVLLFAETFRRAVVAAMAERDDEIERRAILLRELEHRTKNNFALVVSLLDMQKRRAGRDNPEVEEALGIATARIHSFASAYANLADSQGEGASVEIAPYLEEVVSRVRHGAFHDGVEVNLEVETCTLPREVAVAIGLFTNEALTNCAKYAFPEGRKGRVDIRFTGDAEGWELRIADNGVGEAAHTAPENSSGLGSTLFRAFAHQAEAVYELEPAPVGRALSLVRRPEG